MLKKAKAAAEARECEERAEGSRAGGARLVASDLARRCRSVRPRAQEGTKAFETLVQQGEKLEQRTRLAAAETAAAARGAATAKAKEMQQMAGGTWDKLEQVFEDRVARALGKLGVYTQNDVQKLADRVEALSAAVNALLRATGTKAPAAKGAKAKPRTRTAKKSASKSAKKRKTA